MIYQNEDQLKEGCQSILDWREGDVRILDERGFQGELIDDLIYTAVFSPDSAIQEVAAFLIRRGAARLGIIPASIQSLYEAMGKGEVSGFTVPAINIRGLTYDVAQAVFRAAKKGDAGPVIFEIARSEIGYTRQRPLEYACAVLAAAIKTGWRGPVFLQGDHFQINAKRFAAEGERETQAVRDLIREAILASFYNIDIDTSTLVDLSHPTIKDQQRMNFTLAAELTALIRDLEPDGITVSVGGEIGEVGGKNSTVEELQAFMDGYLEELERRGPTLKGISKISVQTGTTHGGVPLADGTVAKVKIDFEVLQKLSETARARYGLAGAVQHGASTLPDEAFDRFPATQTAEIHLATGFQNIIYDSKSFPGRLRAKVYDHLRSELKGEWKEKDTEEQFIYKTRKKGFGPFKQELWELPADVRDEICAELEGKFAFLFDKLKINGTRQLLDRFVKPVDVPLERPAALKG
ncbi:MAG TPA: class II fructose-bisphosphate aldolase [Methanothrix sp.]|jgi:fructose/tagatose bisphosphate aldolase|uniref:class II fructose-bisphosphate aldolase n=2 Tax=Methanothrix sp. TaxID=90426 RepID=UPI002CE141C0|nr:class II fructose-bisphosphate aldolase [Euryarchaeota archaeon]HON35343.1 class II fructose-bisphosphate aldolase [Methanothrix sp.]